MYKYLRNLMDVADLIGEVDAVHFMDWGKNEKRIDLEGKNTSGKKFRLILEMETEDGQDGT